MKVKVQFYRQKKGSQDVSLQPNLTVYNVIERILGLE
jgi:hypothetical protein